MRRFVPIAAMLAWGLAVGCAQGIQWQTKPEQAVALAQRTKRPLMFYVLGSTRDRDHRLERDQKRAFANPRVIELSRRFIPAKLSRVRHRDVLRQLDLPEHANMVIVFVAPDGEMLGQGLSPGGVANADSLAQKMALVFDHYRQQRLFDRELRPILENKDAKASELRTALERVRGFTITGADATVANLLDREGLDPKLATLCRDVLAHLSTKISVAKLLERSWDGDQQAMTALAKCTPAAAEMMLEHMITEDGGIRVDIYRAVTKICRIKSVKSNRWWENAKPRLRQREIERVTGLVRTASKRWKAEHEEYR